MTRRQQVPSGQVKWLWIAALSVPAGMAAFVEKCSGTALVFTLKKFIQDPQAIVALTSLNILFGILVAPIVAWQSDRLHTRWGRRRPFMIPGLILLAVCLVLLPQAQSLGWVIAILVVYQFSMDFGFTGLWKPLYADLVPDEQRGRGMVMNRAMAMAMRLVFMLFLIGRFDQHYGGGKGQGGGHGGGKATQAMESVRWAGLTGEQVIYYSGAALVVLAILFLIFFARESVETVTDSSPRERFHVKRYLGQLFGSPRLRRLYLWVIAATLMSTKLGSLRPLLVTEQFGFSKQMMGNIHTVSMIVNGLIILPLGASLVDRVNRQRLFYGCLLCSTLHPLVFWSYVHFICPVPDPRVVIGFHVVDAAFDHLGLIALWPLLYQSLSSTRRGTAQAGFLVVGGLTSFVVMNVMGAWVKGYSRLCLPDGTYDYMSGYLLVFVLGLAACGLAFGSDRLSGAEALIDEEESHSNRVDIQTLRRPVSDPV